MSSDLKYGKPQEKQGKSKVGLTSEAEGVICALISGILFGTMPLMAKTAYALGSNAYTVAFGRFFTGAVVSGVIILIRYGTVFKITARQLAKVVVLSIRLFLPQHIFTKEKPQHFDIAVSKYR